MGGERGYDGGKRVKGRKRHIAVDSLGLPVAITVTAANVHDTRGGVTVLQQAGHFLRRFSLRRVYADGGYNGNPFRDWVRGKFRATVEIAVNLAKKFKEFVPVSQRWVVERTFSWLYDCRRLTIDYERTIRHSRFMIRLAAIRLMLNRIAPVWSGITAF
jgi:putative transposase